MHFCHCREPLYSRYEILMQPEHMFYSVHFIRIQSQFHDNRWFVIYSRSKLKRGYYALWCIIYPDEWHIQIPELLIVMRERKATKPFIIYVTEQDSKLLPYLHVLEPVTTTSTNQCKVQLNHILNGTRTEAPRAGEHAACMA